MLPKLNGKEVLRKIREVSTIPVIIISAKDSELDKILGLELGADDYITKPFSLNELNARINASLRRIGYFKNSLPKESKIQRGELTLDLDNYQLIKNGTPIDLTAKEFEIIKLLLENPKRVFTKTQLFSSIWQDDFMKDENTVMVHIRRVREKIEDNPSEPKYIKTIWGIGYKLGDV
ncbi:putative transcriptional regulatory protein YcbL [Clostridium folliculivorans]|uniref:Stage 0 sporulation protein A homolog n=2 Tax=Clostridium folliculivorans TaxID=2886038 RepID=A0A9W6DCC3_9CLOT|nr:putative transcriptional regulatory protein YcbL [Clostridium folliculivorans]GKU32196.1 putative transcriptional regulatory protein YcbL [Clostridium folliculivorans]